MGKGGGGGTSLPKSLTKPTPVAPVSPAAKSTPEVAAAGIEEKARRRVSYGAEKTLLSRGAGQIAENDKLGS